MNVGIATIAAFLLLLPGIAFIVGVNIADKNVREIVFRNTPAELGYVIAVSLAVHLVLAIFTALLVLSTSLVLPANPPSFLAFIFRALSKFNAGAIYSEYLHLGGSADRIRNVLIFSLSYFLIAAGVGFYPGFVLGSWIQARRYRWTTFFVKHRWMLDLIQADKAPFVTARAVLKDKFTTKENDTTQHPLVIRGLLRDSYFGADGKLLYLVFQSFVVLMPDGSQSDYLKGLGSIDRPTAAEDKAPTEQLLLEGDRIETVRFSRRPQADNLDKRLRESEAATASMSDPN